MLKAMLPKNASCGDMRVSFRVDSMIQRESPLACWRSCCWYHQVPYDPVWYHLVPMSRAHTTSDATVRERILTAAFDAFRERGYAATSTLEIATRARVSKRELYALVGNKQQMLIAAI